MPNDEPSAQAHRGSTLRMSRRDIQKPVAVGAAAWPRFVPRDGAPTQIHRVLRI
jgi:hypothetical protein